MITASARVPRLSQVYVPEPVSVTRKEIAKVRSTKRRALQLEARIKALAPRAADPAAAVQLNALQARLQALRS